MAALACSSDKPRAPAGRDARVSATADAALARTLDAQPPLPAHRTFPDLASALSAIVPPNTRVIGIGELHARVDRKQVRSSLAAFTDVVPVLGSRMSDLVVETYVVDPKCGAKAQTATKRLETAVRRPEATKSELGKLVDAARAARVQPHAMTVACKDYDVIAPPTGEPDPVAMLTFTTKELTRVTSKVLAERGKQQDARPWIVVYGGALHNDRYPAEGVAEWSYAAAIDKATQDTYVELDLFAPELVEGEPLVQNEPWFPLIRATGAQVVVHERGERSFVVLLPRSGS